MDKHNLNKFVQGLLTKFYKISPVVPSCGKNVPLHKNVPNTAQNIPGMKYVSYFCPLHGTYSV
jgi:hypothetical protein